MTPMVNADPLHFFEKEFAPRACEACGSSSLTTGRLAAYDRVDMFACDECGDFWFECDGARMNAEAMRRLGLLLP
jgi:hypothetical protein